MPRKFRFHNDRGAEEDHIGDPDTGELEDGRRAEGELRDIRRRCADASAPVSAFGFEPGEGSGDLKIYGPNGARFRASRDAGGRARARVGNPWNSLGRIFRIRNLGTMETPRVGRPRGKTQKQRADGVEKLLESERQRAERLAARLRELGGSMD